MATNEKAVCEICGEPMPPDEEMFNYHGYSGPCPMPPKPKLRAADDATSEWKPISERPEIDHQPGRQFVLIDGVRHHSGVAWGRKHWGLAYVRKPGSDDELQQYRRSDIEQILKDGDMDYGDVTHWMPASCPAPFPAE